MISVDVTKHGKASLPRSSVFAVQAETWPIKRKHSMQETIDRGAQSACCGREASVDGLLSRS